MPARSHPLIARLRALAAPGPVIVAHRGASRQFPENTLESFTAAARLGVAMQEFDVRVTRDGQLICIHDDSFDRTTDAATRIGPGSLVAETTMDRVGELDAGSWHPYGKPASVPKLAAALDVMLPDAIPLIEHKAGSAAAYVDELRRLDRLSQCILQSFDWRFVAEAHRLAPDLCLAALGPTRGIDQPDAAALELAAGTGAQMIHWDHRQLTTADVERIHAADMLVCTYTCDDEEGMRHGAAIGIDAICTNVPGTMLELARAGDLARPATD